jgi:diguanylate cyclase (GGDEF)-like protein
MEESITWEKDFLTNCFTRNSLYPFLDKLQLEASTTNKPFSIMLIDLDHFKTMNDKYGHVFGDDVLKYFSSSLRLVLEGDDVSGIDKNFIFRYGGDEFIIVFPGKRSHEAYRKAQRILYNIRRRHFLFRGRQFKITFSGGIATFPRDATSIDKLIECADRAMYFSKRHGKGKATQFSKIRVERIKWFLSAFLMFAAIAALLWTANLYSQGRLRHHFFFWKKSIQEKTQAKNIPEALYTIHLKSGGVLKGVINKNEDPLKVRLIFDKGEGLIYLKKSEILKIEPELK